MLYILIDDDTLIHQLWKMEASESADVELICFESVKCFLSHHASIPKEAMIYIDSNLDGLRGEEEAAKVHELGFQNIFIASGYNPEDIVAPDFVKGVIGKRPPF